MCSDYYRDTRPSKRLDREGSVGARSGRELERQSIGYREFDRGVVKRYPTKDDRYDYYSVQPRAVERPMNEGGGTEYRTLCLSNINPRIQDATIKEAIHQEFKKFGDFNIKIVQVGHERRIAYVNFRYPDDARDAKYARENRLVLFDMPIRIDSVYPKKRYNDAQEDYGRSFANKAGFRQEDRGDSYQGLGDNRQREHKFPHHLHHIQPEDDEKATRTLFIGNLDITTTVEDLRHIFEKYGFVEDVDIKRPTKGAGNAYAFIRFGNLDMAHRAKVDMSGRYIGKLQCKIGYGKANITNCLWIGGLGSWVSTNILEAEFDRFGVIHRIHWNEGSNYAFVLYDSQDAALAASKAMRGFPLGGPDRRLRIDFSDPAAMDAPPFPKESVDPRAIMDRSKREASDWGKRGYYGDERGERPNHGTDYRAPDDYFKPRTDDLDVNTEGERWKTTRQYPEDDVYRTRQSQSYDREYPRERDLDPAPPESKRQRLYNREDSDYYHRGHNSNGNYPEGVPRPDSSLFNDEAINSSQSIQELAKNLPVVWSGALVLKNSAFSSRMHLVSGNVQLVDTLMRDQTTTEMPLLKITQRLRLDQPKLDDMSRRVSASAPNGYSILLAMPGSDAALEEANTKVQHRPLKNLVSYLKQKEAAGVIPLPPNTPKDQELGVLHAFPPCAFGLDYLLKRAPHLGSDTTRDDHLVVVVVSGSA